MTVRELLHMPAAAAAEVIYSRVPAKAWALMRALQELTASGAAPKPPHGREIERRRAAQVAQEERASAA
jgi:hypothetical protein